MSRAATAGLVERYSSVNRGRGSTKRLIDEKRLTAIHLLVTGFSQRNVCRIVRISPVTLNKWWDEPAFRAEFYRATGLDGKQEWKVGSGRVRGVSGQQVTNDPTELADQAGAD